MDDKTLYEPKEKVYWEGFEKDQYEDLNMKYFPIGGIVGRYIRQEDQEYQDNLLVEGLPPDKKEEQVIEELTQVPLFSIDERKRSKKYRINAVSRTLDFHYPTIKDVAVYWKIYGKIKASYKYKNIDLKGNYEKTLELAQLAREKHANLLQNNKTLIEQGAPQILGFLIVGPSGVGKTTGINMVLKSIPQVIIHENTSCKYIEHKQITWLKVECTPTGGIKGMCIKIIGEIDRVLGTNYLERIGGQRIGVDHLVMEIKHLSILHSLGTLIIDEIQNLTVTKDNTKVLNFLLSLSNEINLPIIYIGTQEAETKLFSTSHRLARRAEGDGIVEYEFLTREEFNQFLDFLWGYQWTEEYTELTEEIRELMYRYSIGIPARIIKIFSKAQVDAIVEGGEKIDEKQIKKAIKSFPIGNKMIEAFLRGDTATLVKLGDVAPLEVELNSIVNEAIDSLEMQEAIRKYQEDKMHIKVLNKKKLCNELTYYFAAFGYGPEVTRKTVETVVNKYYGKKQNTDLHHLIAKELLKKEKPKESTKNEGEESESTTKDI